MTTTVEVPETLPELARVVVPHLQEAFPGADLVEYQVFNLAEEAGEVVGAYRRWKGMARRNSSWVDVCDELADVIITAYVTAEVLGVDLHEHRPAVRRAEGVMVLDLFRRTGMLVAEYEVYAMGEGGLYSVGDWLGHIAGTAQEVAFMLDIDLEVAWQDKAERILTRGWKD